MNTFKKFKLHLKSFLVANRITSSDIEYISLTKHYWISYDDFFDLEEPPKIWNMLSEGPHGEFYLSRDFRIVLNKYTWIDYRLCEQDPYYSAFHIHQVHQKPSKKYESHHRTLGDFLPEKVRKNPIPQDSLKPFSTPNLE